MDAQKILEKTKRTLKRNVNTFNQKVTEIVSGNKNIFKRKEIDYGYIDDEFSWRRMRKKFADSRIFYAGFILVVGLFCILITQVLPGSKLRIWVHSLRNEPIINKSIQYTRNDGQIKEWGTFLTNYRFRSFGSSNPDDVDANAPMVALTFDDGPNPTNTERILNVLNANYSHATFFVVGTNAEIYQDTLKAISASGSEIGNHTYNHKDLTSVSSEEVEEQIDKVNRAVKKATGENTTVIRPPYGAYNEEVLKQLDEPIVLWDLDTEDWDSRNAKKVVDEVMSNIKDGDIVLMHDIYDSTAEAVEILVPKLKEQGYQIVSISEMAEYKGKKLELHKAYGEIESSTEP